MSLFPELDKMTVKFAILLPHEHSGYLVYYTQSITTAHHILHDVERIVLSIDREILDERPLIAVLTGKRELPVVNILFVPIRDLDNTQPMIIPITSESSLFETSKKVVRENMAFILVKNTVSVFKTTDPHNFIDKIGVFLERYINQPNATYPTVQSPPTDT